jgi:hypothetical protein
MQAVSDLELALIELEYDTADCLYRKMSTSDPSERSDLEALLTKIRIARVAVQFALDSMIATSDRNLPQAA